MMAFSELLTQILELGQSLARPIRLFTEHPLVFLTDPLSASRAEYVRILSSQGNLHGQATCEGRGAPGSEDLKVGSMF